MIVLVLVLVVVVVVVVVPENIQSLLSADDANHGKSDDDHTS